MLVIKDTVSANIGTIGIILIAIFIIYIGIDIFLMQLKVEKLKKAAALIEEGHKKKERALK